MISKNLKNVQLESFPIVIFGSGPAGMSTALELEKKKLNVSWNRSQVLKDLRFYQIIPGLLASPFMVTGVFFHQIHLIESKSWSMKLLASSYPFFALSVIGVTFVAGWVVDRFSTVHLLRFFLESMIVRSLVARHCHFDFSWQFSRCGKRHLTSFFKHQHYFMLTAGGQIGGQAHQHDMQTARGKRYTVTSGNHQPTINSTHPHHPIIHLH